MKEALIFIKKVELKTIADVLSEYHKLSDGIVPSYVIELRQTSMDTYVLSFPTGITYNEYENLLLWFNNEIKAEKDIYGYNTTKHLKKVRTTTNAMFWVEPSNGNIMFCREDGLTYSETDDGFEIVPQKRKYLPLDVQWKASSSLIKSYAFVYVDTTRSEWKWNLIFYSRLIAAMVLFFLGYYAFLSTVLRNSHWIIIGIIALIVSFCWGWKSKGCLFEKIENRLVNFLTSFFVIASIVLSINYYLRIGTVKQQVVVIEELYKTSGRHNDNYLYWAKFSFPPNNNIKVKIPVKSDFYNTLESGDTCIADYRKGLLGITVIDSLYKPK